ncbi:hypothetical protein RHMOL_Rhmol06G0226400 [Rhododendron molle]|nr:hypothetical protein RHMOL_Rhmol06G0226400 [Rhododendron molle]
MDPLKPRPEETEIGPEATESITLSVPPEVVCTDSPVKGDKNEVETDVVEGKSNILVSLRESLVGAKKVVQERWLKCFSSGRADRTRAYQVWQGNNVFFCRGRLICGPDPRGLLLTAVSISLSSWIFTVYIARDFPNRPSLIIAFSVTLTLMVIVNLIAVSAIDPGIIPRNDQSDVEEVSTSGRTRRKRVTVNGMEVKLKYCRT